MLNLLNRARGARVPVSSAASCACSSGGDSDLQVALKQVTHSGSAAVPPEVLDEAVRLASDSEDAIVLSLRHIEENVSAPPHEWRRIHGALQLLERLLRPRAASSSSSSSSGLVCSDVLVGRVWYEAKMEERLNTLVNFEYQEDDRVALLVRRAAVSAQNSAQKNLPAHDWDDDASPDLCTRLESRPDSEQSGGSSACANNGNTRISKRQSVQSQCNSPPVSIIGCSTVNDGANVNDPILASNRVRNAAAALDALNDSSTRCGRSGQDAKSSPPHSQVSDHHKGMQTSLRCCCCFRRRQIRSRGGTGDCDTDLEVEGDEADSLL